MMEFIAHVAFDAPLCFEIRPPPQLAGDHLAPGALNSILKCPVLDEHLTQAGPWSQRACTRSSAGRASLRNSKEFR